MNTRLRLSLISILLVCFGASTVSLSGADGATIDRKQKESLLINRLKIASSGQDFYAALAASKEAGLFADEKLGENATGVSRKERLEFKLEILDSINAGIDEKFDPED